MPLLTLIILAVIQGLTEFLPVSSSGHLVLVHNFLGDAEKAWEENLMMDVAVHVGTLFAVLLYFNKDITEMLFFRNISMILRLIIGSVPVVIAGYFLHSLSSNPDWEMEMVTLRSLEVMAWATILFGILLWISDRMTRNKKMLQEMNLFEAFLIGIAQCFALIPGTSRSGVTMTAGRFLGFTRTESARFSLLLSIVALAGAGALLGKDVIEQGNAELTESVLLAAGLSFIAALISITAMMRFLERFSFAPFAIYRLALGTALLYLIYAGMI